ncbi:hypothetical protein MAE02_40580 [Microvirga aerophila]|uniref:Uncharacterized protein n=1 Tax=Microvirga aerophila TaxID=670291 RepID=A0A512BWM6_9HYPH|nr:hypothetical protein MAE02_40580 [Microvirga aerophila]
MPSIRVAMAAHACTQPYDMGGILRIFVRKPLPPVRVPGPITVTDRNSHSKERHPCISLECS